MDFNKCTHDTTSFQNRIFKSIHNLEIGNQCEDKTVWVLQNAANLNQDDDTEGAEVVAMGIPHT